MGGPLRKLGQQEIFLIPGPQLCHAEFSVRKIPDREKQPAKPLETEVFAVYKDRKAANAAKQYRERHKE